MGGVAQQHHRAVAPAGQGIAIDDRPFVHARAGVDDAPDLLVKAGERGAELVEVAGRRPGFHGELRLRHAGDEIDLVAVRRDVIDDDVAIRPPPFAALFGPVTL